MDYKLPFKPLPWQKDALNDLKKSKHKVKFLQRAGGGGKTYCSYLYFLQQYGANGDVLIIAKPGELYAWGKWFDPHENAEYVSKGLVRYTKFADHDVMTKKWDLIIIDEADDGLSSMTSTTFKMINKLKSKTKEMLLVSATLFDDKMVQSIPLMKLAGYNKKNIVNEYFDVETEYLYGQREIETIVGINNDKYDDYMELVWKHGYIAMSNLELITSGNVDEFDYTEHKYGVTQHTRWIHEIKVNSTEVNRTITELSKNNMDIHRNFPVIKQGYKQQKIKLADSGMFEGWYGDEVFDTFKFDALMKFIEETNFKKILIMTLSTSEGDEICKRLSKQKEYYWDRYTPHDDSYSEFHDADYKSILVGGYNQLARSLDVSDLQCVIMFTPPQAFKHYRQGLYRVSREGSKFENTYTVRFISSRFSNNLWKRLDSRKGISKRFWSQF